MFHGCITALITPMDSKGAIDWASLEKMVFFQMAHNIQALVLLGSTGEGWSFTENERRELIRQVRTWLGDRLPLIVGTGQTGTQDTENQTRVALQEKADAVLIVTPPYNKPTQAGLYHHYKTIADAIPIPIVLYNVPSRTGVDLKPETVMRLAELPNIVALKETVTDPMRYRALIQQVGSRLDILSGEDSGVFDAMASGGKGLVSVTSNLLPQAMSDLCDLISKGNLKEAFVLQETLLPKHQALFVESNPIPVKWALFRAGLIASPMVRSPLLPLSSVYHETLAQLFECF